MIQCTGGREGGKRRGGAPHAGKPPLPCCPWRRHDHSALGSDPPSPPISCGGCTVGVNTWAAWTTQTWCLLSNQVWGSKGAMADTSGVSHFWEVSPKPLPNQLSPLFPTPSHNCGLAIFQLPYPVMSSEFKEVIFKKQSTFPESSRQLNFTTSFESTPSPCLQNTRLIT